MVIIQIEGGLGNQMFQYALYLSFIDRGVTAKLDISKFKNEFAHNGYELEKVFNLNASYCSVAEKPILKALSKILHVLTKHPYKEKEHWQWVYHQEVATIKLGFLKGYWQSEKYFLNISSKIREKFNFPSPQGDKNKEALIKITTHNSVSVHIRRGDYLTNSNPCFINIEYYFQAILIMNKKVDNPYYFVFSDDIKWARENIKESQIEFVDWNTQKNSFIDMQLMSRCKHNIIANSSFSWWGAWLNSNPYKIVIAPQQWMPHLEKSGDIVPKDWLQLPSGF